ncbi:cytochrome C oxidase subunit I [Arenicella xantha]|uniref:Cytochrome oxidase Cu insertion factor (SCO1/SenC/PrrC family) n=1 Tax=Arenicella xantha TaxID=644221 RepID=A0A395JND5_9GAMM|nr:cytochrome C oxidase subunit I [Arenicella xantha]RBP53079.1 hypothetical protein DFR28_101464 [Arenicella xantha]
MTELNNTTPAPKASGNKAQFWNRVQMVLILVVFAAPVVAAYFYKPTHFNNYGDIYQPVRPVSNLMMHGTDGVVEMDSLRRQWVFLIVAQDACSAECEANILKMRQLRFMQNNDMTRIRTVFLHSGLTDELAVDLAAKYSPIEAYSSEPAAFQEWVKVLKLDDAPKEAEKDRFYVIDPAGNLMMSYPASADPNIMKKDVKRLLKASQIG